MTEPNRQSEENEERIIEIEIERLRPFKEHPFQVKDDKEMFLLQESIEKYGILNPLIVRPVPDGYYEIISGHRRKHAAEKLGYRKVPVIIRVLLTSQAFREQYNIDRNSGKVGNLYGFEIYEYGNNPLYTTAGVKKALGTTAEAGEFPCSFAFYKQRVFKATGSTKMYYSESKNDPLNQRNLINFRHYFICMPKKEDAGVVMMSGYQA